MDYRPFLDLSPEMACVLSLDEGRVVDLNAAWEPRLGYSEGELRDRPFTDLVLERDRARAAAALGRLAKGDAMSGAEHRFLHKDGSFRWITWSALARPEAGLIFATAREIGEGGLNLRQLKAIVDGTTDFVGLAGPGGDVIYINPSGMKMVGRAGESYAGLRIADVRTEKGLSHVRDVIRPAALRDGVWSGETEFRGPGGKPFPAWQVFFVIRDEDGVPESLGSIARDISDRKRREAELQKFKAIVDSASDFIALASVGGAIRYVNASGLRLLGRRAEEVPDLTLSRMFTPSSHRDEPEIRQALAEGRSWTGETELRCADGRAVPVATLVMGIRVGDERTEEVAIVARDLTSHRSAVALKEAIRAMSTPILEVWRGVLLLPVIGAVDSARAAEMTESLLNAVVRTRCRMAILDLTGVEVMDTSTLGHLFKIVSATALLGSSCVVSGISARVAQTIAGLGIELSGLRAFRTLEDALAFALRQAEV
jgi:rsbT co-antagonist protein RsbR